MLMCRDVRNLLHPFLRNSLPADTRLNVHHHLATCAECSLRVEQARDAFDLSRSACASAADPIPDDVPEPLLRAIWMTSHAHR